MTALQKDTPSGARRKGRSEFLSRADSEGEAIPSALPHTCFDQLTDPLAVEGSS